MPTLTAKQQSILENIRELISQRGENPTSYKLHKYLEAQGVRDSLKSVMQVIEALEKKDLIKRDKDRKVYLVENETKSLIDFLTTSPGLSQK